MVLKHGLERLAKRIINRELKGTCYTSLYSADILAFTPCNICRLLRPPWPILIHLDELKSNWTSCPGCNLIRAVSKDCHVNGLEDPRDVTVDFREGKMYVRSLRITFLVYVSGGMYAQIVL
jgi:hypothetical protein